MSVASFATLTGPFDARWLYWEADTKLLDEKRASYKPHVFEGKSVAGSAVRGRSSRMVSSEPEVHHSIAWEATNQMDGSASPLSPPGSVKKAWHSAAAESSAVPTCRTRRNATWTASAWAWRTCSTTSSPCCTTHPTGKANAGALRMEWPRIPLPGWPDGDTPGAAEELATSAARGRELAALLDSETPVPGVTTGALRPEMAAIAVPSTTDGGNMAGDDFSVTASWGHFGQGEAVMPGQGRAVERAYTAEERAALGESAHTLGDTTFDIYLNDRAYWRNVPSAVWHYKLGGYQVLKKWLSYRERGVLDRPLRPEEVQHFTDTARRIAGILGW